MKRPVTHSRSQTHRFFWSRGWRNGGSGLSRYRMSENSGHPFINSSCAFIFYQPMKLRFFYLRPGLLVSCAKKKNEELWERGCVVPYVRVFFQFPPNFIHGNKLRNPFELKKNLQLETLVFIYLLK